MRRRPASRILPGLLLSIAVAAGAAPAWARTADRNQAMNTEANHQTGTFADDSVNVMTGDVRINQGSLDIRAARAEITMRGGDPVRAVLTGSPVTLKQQMDDGTPMSASASTVDYNLNTDIVVFTGSVEIQQTRGSMSGQRVVYNLKTGNVDSGGEGNGRVKMKILPKNAKPTAEAPVATDTPARDVQ
jgi:lipopolysaccharide export system protein LptA